MVMGTLTREADLAVLGGGPGGYVAALRAASLGLDVVLVEQRTRMGGTCLLEGCIPSKSIINAVALADAAEAGPRMGLCFDGLRIDLAALRQWKQQVVARLAHGVDSLLQRRGVEVLRGRGRFVDAHELAVDGDDATTVRFRHAIIATGSSPIELPGASELALWSSRDALALSEVPTRLLVVGGGVIGLELGLAYARLGSRVSVVDASPRFLPAGDPELASVLERRCRRRFAELWLGTHVGAMERTRAGIAVTLEGAGPPRTDEVDRVLVAVGRRPNVAEIGLERLGLSPDGAGFIAVDAQGRTSAPHVFAIGDVTAGPMLAHKAGRQARVAAEAVAGQRSSFDNRAIPSVIYTDPEMAWTGLTERQAADGGRPLQIGRFPLTSLGRAHTLGATDGLVKVVSERGSGALLGVGMVGPHVSELIGEATLALEMGATLEDLMVTIHPHPTLSEALGEAAEVAAGVPIHVPPEPPRSFDRGPATPRPAVQA